MYDREAWLDSEPVGFVSTLFRNRKESVAVIVNKLAATASYCGLFSLQNFDAAGHNGGYIGFRRVLPPLGRVAFRLLFALNSPAMLTCVSLFFFPTACFTMLGDAWACFYRRLTVSAPDKRQPNSPGHIDGDSQHQRALT